MMRATRLALLVLIALCLGGTGFAIVAASLVDRGPLREQVRDAEAAYDRGVALMASDPEAARASLQDSARQYESLWRNGLHTPGLAYNLGNARLRARDIPGAIAAYHAALALDPSDSRAAHNLAEARRQVGQRVAPPKATLGARVRNAWWLLSGTERLFLAAAAWNLGCAALVWVVLRRRVAEEIAATSGAEWQRTTGVVLLIVGALLGGTILGDAVATAQSNLAVTGSQTVLRKGNGEGFDPVLTEPLPAGTEFHTHEMRPGWVEIELGDGTRGWISAANLVQFKPSE